MYPGLKKVEVKFIVSKIKIKTKFRSKFRKNNNEQIFDQTGAR